MCFLISNKIYNLLLSLILTSIFTFVLWFILPDDLFRPFDLSTDSVSDTSVCLDKLLTLVVGLTFSFLISLFKS